MAQTLTIRAVVPHFHREGLSRGGYGSERAGQRLARSCALMGCLNGLINLRHEARNYMLDVANASSFETVASSIEPQRPEITVEVHVFTTGGYCLGDVLELMGRRIVVHELEIENPRYLPHAARDFLIQNPQPADLNLYFEDDLIIHDPFFALKMLWMADQSEHRAVLLPHRYELTTSPGAHPRLYVDGPAEPEIGMETWHQPAKNVAKGSFRGQTVSFDRPQNPHAGCFGLSSLQVAKIANQKLPHLGYIGPLETVATYTIGKYFQILKANETCLEFFALQHAHPSFLGYLS